MGLRTFTFAGTSSSAYSMFITEAATYNVPERAVEMLEIPGRSGHYALDQGRFENVEVTYHVVVHKDTNSNFQGELSDVRNWLASKVGYQRLTDDYNTGVYRMAIFKGGIDIGDAYINGAEFDIVFECKPQRWLTSGETPIEIGAWGDTQTVSGDIVQFNALETDKVKSLVADIDPVQDLHGYDKPWVGGAGKNKLDISSVTTSTSANWGVTISNGELTVEHKNTYSTGVPKTADIELSAGTYCVSYNATTEIVLDVYANGSWLKAVNNGGTFTLSASSTVYIAFPNTQATTITYKKVQLESGSTPTSYEPYENLCPISGWSGVDVYDDPKHGGIIEWNQLVQNGNFADTSVWSSVSASFTVSGNVASMIASAQWGRMYNNLSVVNGHQYFVSADIKGTTNNYVDIGFRNKYLTTDNAWENASFIATSTVTGTRALAIGDKRSSGWTAVQVKNVICVDLTECFGAGNEPTTVDEFKALFPKDYYAYNAGTETCVSAVNGDPYNKVTVSWSGDAGTVYGGTVDVVSGVLTVTHAIVDMGDLSWNQNPSFPAVFYASLSGAAAGRVGEIMCISSAYAPLASCPFSTLASNEGSIIIQQGYATVGVCNSQYADANAFKTGNTGVKVVYELATPQTTTLTAQEVSLLLGQNTVFADTGDITLEYGQDPSVVINPTPFEAEPLLAVKGYGTIDFNGYEIEIENGDLGTIQLASSKTMSTDTDTISLSNTSSLNLGDTIYFSRDLIDSSVGIRAGNINASIDSSTLTSSSNVVTTPKLIRNSKFDFSVKLVADMSARFAYGTSSTITSTAVFSAECMDSTNITVSASLTVVYDGDDTITVTRAVSVVGKTMLYLYPSMTIDEIYGDSTVNFLGDPTFIDCDLGECYKYESGEIVSLNGVIALGSDLPKLSSGANTFTMDGTVTELKVTPRWWKV